MTAGGKVGLPGEMTDEATGRENAERAGWLNCTICLTNGSDAPYIALSHTHTHTHTHTHRDTHTSDL